MQKFAEVKGKCTGSLSNSSISAGMHDQGILGNMTKRKLNILSKQFLGLLPEVAEIICPVGPALD